MALAAVERNALLEQVLELWKNQDHLAIADILTDLPVDELLREPELGIALCNAWYHLGDLHRPLVLIQQLTDVCERRGNSRIARRRINAEAMVRLARCELDEAEALLQQVLARAEEAEDMLLAAWAYNNTGILHGLKRNWDFALSHYRRAIVAGQRAGDTHHLAVCHHNIGSLYRRMGQLRESREYSNIAADLARDVGNESVQALIQYNQGFTQAEEGDWALARVAAAKAHTTFEKLDNDRGRALLSELQGYILMQEGYLAAAENTFLVGLALARAVLIPDTEASLMERLSALSRLNGDSNAVIRYLEGAKEVYARMGSQADTARIEVSLQQALEETREHT